MKIEFATIEPFFATLVHYGSKSEVSGEVGFFIFYFSGRTVFFLPGAKAGLLFATGSKSGILKQK